ncbi:hypothetical protein LJC24_01520 [Desulfococcaceae bacterium OttesenSCG-928-F15]|nr:hypothetical protein [Desulfococcaceae bacterium OttesenSCG-928-F15]
MEIRLNLNEELVKWYEKRAGNLGLEIEDLVDFVLTAYAKKTDPKKAAPIPVRARVAAGLGEDEALHYMHFPLEKRLWQGAMARAEQEGIDTTIFLTRLIHACISEEDS